VSLSLTLSKNEIVEQHIRKKTHKSNVLRFWLKVPCMFGSVLILVRSPWCLPLRIFPAKTHKPNVLKFWVEGGVILFYMDFGSVLIIWDLPGVSPSDSLNKWYQSRRFVAVTGSYECSLIPVSKVFLTDVLRKRVPFKCINDDTSKDRLWLRYSYLKMFPLDRSVPM